MHIGHFGKLPIFETCLTGSKDFQCSVCQNKSGYIFNRFVQSQVLMHEPRTDFLEFCLFCTPGFFWQTPNGSTHKPIRLLLEKYETKKHLKNGFEVGRPKNYFKHDG